MSQRRGMTDAEMEDALRGAGADLAYPQPVDLTAAVRARVIAPRDRGVGPRWLPRIAVVPVLVTLALLVLVTLAFQPVGTQAAEALGLRGLVIFRTPATPSPTASVTPTSTVLFDAHRVASVDAASHEAGFAVGVPTALGTPNEVYVRVDGQTSEVFLVYAARPGSVVGPIPPSGQTGIGVLVTEARGSFQFGLLGKLAGPNTKVDQTSIKGSPAVWIEGLHQFFYQDATGQFVQDSVRLSGSALVWNKGDLLIRIETDLPEDRAVTIAGTIP